MVTLPAYDSGGDDGTTYNSKDRDTNPKKPVSRAANRHFVVRGKVKPVATVTFVKKPCSHVLNPVHIDNYGYVVYRGGPARRGPFR